MSESIMQMKKDFVFRLSQFILNKGQFTVVEDLPVTKQIRKANRLSQKASPRTGQPGAYEVYLIRIAADGYEADLEMFKTELTRLAIAFPDGVTNYKGVTIAHDGTHWVYVCGGNGDTSFQPSIQNTPKNSSELRTNSPSTLNTRINQLKEAIKLSATLGTQMNAANVIKVAESIEPGNALGLITSAKAAGEIFEQDGVYRTA